MPSKHTLKKWFERAEDNLFQAGVKLMEKAEQIQALKDELALQEIYTLHEKNIAAGLKAQLLTANESWAREKNRADENVRMVQAARAASEKLTDAVYPGLNFKPRTIPISGDFPRGIVSPLNATTGESARLLDKAKDQFPEAFGKHGKP